MVLSFLRWVMRFSSLGSLSLSSKQVQAEMNGFLKLFNVKELNGPNGNFCGVVKGREKGTNRRIWLLCGSANYRIAAVVQNCTVWYNFGIQTV
jgi:hypothetical protein